MFGFAFKEILTHELSFTGPSTIELALGISSGSRYCLVNYTYYTSTAPLPSNFKFSVYRNGIEKNCDGQFIPPDARCVLAKIAACEAMWGSVPRERKKGRSVHVRSHIRNRPNLLRYVFSKIFAAMRFPSQGSRRSNLHWTSSQGPGTVSCTTRTAYLLLCLIEAKAVQLDLLSG